MAALSGKSDIGHLSDREKAELWQELDRVLNDDIHLMYGKPFVDVMTLQAFKTMKVVEESQVQRERGLIKTWEGDAPVIRGQVSESPYIAMKLHVEHFKDADCSIFDRIENIVIMFFTKPLPDTPPPAWYTGNCVFRKSEDKHESLYNYVVHHPCGPLSQTDISRIGQLLNGETIHVSHSIDNGSRTVHFKARVIQPE